MRCIFFVYTNVLYALHKEENKKAILQGWLFLWGWYRRESNQ